MIMHCTQHISSLWMGACGGYTKLLKEFNSLDQCSIWNKSGTLSYKTLPNVNFLTLNLVNFYYLPLTLTQDLYSYQTFLKAVNWYKRVALNCMVLEFVIYLVTMVMIKIQFFLFHMYIAMANCYSVIIMYKQEEETLASICIPIHAADYQLLYDLWLLCSFGRHWLTSSRSWYAKIKFPSDN